MILKKKEKYVLNLIKKRDKYKVSDLIKSSQISPTSLRRILTKLDEYDLINRSWGEVSLKQNDNTNIEYTGDEKYFHEKLYKNKKLKEAIALEAANSLTENARVFLASGTTTSLVPMFCKQKLTFMTNNVILLKSIIEDHISIIMLNGEYHKNNEALLGDLVVQNMENLYATHTIVGCTGLHPASGATTGDYHEGIINKTMLKKSIGQKIIVADSSKIGLGTNFKFAGVSDFDTIITDSNADPILIGEFIKQGINVKIVTI